MALDFPASPSTGQTYTGPNGVVWQWDGAKWVAGTAAGAYAPIASPAFTGNPTAPTPPAGDADNSIATTAFVAASTATALTNVGRNLIHNSMFNVAQRGAGPFVAGGFTLDRWRLAIVSDTASLTRVPVADVSRASIGDEAAQFCLQHAFTGNAAAGAYTQIVQAVEGVYRLAGKTVTLSFWAAGSAVFKVGVNGYQYFGTGGTTPPPSAGVVLLATGSAVTLSTTWARYSVTIAIPSVAGKTIGTNGDDYTAVQLFLSSGATNNQTAGNIGVQSGTIYLWGVQLELGSTATPLEKLDPATQLQQCQRFYQVGTFYFIGYGTAGMTTAISVNLPVAMRATPQVAAVGGNVNANVGALAYSSFTNFYASVSATVTASSQYTINQTFSASADL